MSPLTFSVMLTVSAAYEPGLQTTETGANATAPFASSVAVPPELDLSRGCRVALHERLRGRTGRQRDCEGRASRDGARGDQRVPVPEIGH